ncbi:hypothetical protein SODALDRAFT_286293 [Sodiomyces alkalinus F11]|uniref:Thymidylate kinase n=1 Tax=Sodiomyces alkalinus (strain CBS 110278 / VKM F-3762 / F11) TaxID=1314773 RepID=A0A3N2PJ83_SODAK|nr:hypothetical protein SODALDRAFT_286293 [Sodiomyces alkalinus F11]ROT34597.1 hypothetical protein SODALDRAFT_286293 [Sodiomyces alkalinus F11]
MATITRQPFAPLDGTRLQNLTSLKNRQNALPPSSGAKRKAADPVDTDDSENVDPSVFKRSKGNNTPLSKDVLKPSSYLLTKTSTPLKHIVGSLSTPNKPSVAFSLTSPRRRRAVPQPRSPAAKLTTSITKSSSPPLSAPAGRSPTRGKRSGILSNHRRHIGPYSRVDPPLFSSAASSSFPSSSSSAAAPFSLDAALKGTIPSYAARQSIATPTSSSAARAAGSSKRGSRLDHDLRAPEMKASWFFDIHEDTPEQEMTNLLQHSTCVLDISSDEESEEKATRERAEGRDKENIPPSDDVSQTTSGRAVPSARHALEEDDMAVEKQRMALGEMDASAFYAAGCDENSAILVPGDEDEDEVETDVEDQARVDTKETCKDVVDELMSESNEPAAKAAVLEPIEGTGEGFELWEGGSADDDGVQAQPATATS